MTGVCFFVLPALAMGWWAWQRLSVWWAQRQAGGGGEDGGGGSLSWRERAVVACCWYRAPVPKRRPEAAPVALETAAPSSSRSSAINPPSLSTSVPAWQRYETDDGLPYWHNPETGERTWEDPAAA